MPICKQLFYARYSRLASNIAALFILLSEQ